jgi:hypothetical protein
MPMWVAEVMPTQDGGRLRRSQIHSSNNATSRADAPADERGRPGDVLDQPAEVLAEEHR